MLISSALDTHKTLVQMKIKNKTFYFLFQLINIKMASCIVNNSPANIAADNHSGGSLNHNSEAVNFPSSPFGVIYPLYYRAQSSSREFKNGLFSVAPLKPPLTELFNRFQGATTQNNNLIQTSNDHVDVAPSSDAVVGPIGPAVGYPFPATKTKVAQHFKQFSFNLGRFGFQGTGAFHYQNIYPYGVR